MSLIINIKNALVSRVCRLPNLFIFGSLFPPTFIILKKKKLLYFITPKTGCTSIRKTFIEEDVNSLYEIDTKVIKYMSWGRKLTKEEELFYAFTFVRNPYDRIASSFKNKFIQDPDRGVRGDMIRDKYLFGLFKNIETFEDFVKYVIKIPDIFSDPHFQSCSSLLSKYIKKIDFIGKFENLGEEMDPIIKKYNLQSLGHYNNSNKGDWRDFYTEETAKKIYKRYKKDFDTWYPDEYEKLLEYIRNK